MTTIKGEYYVLSEILKGTAINDTFEIGSGSEYVFGYYGSDIAVYPGKINKVKSALYYRGLGFAVIVVEGTLNILDTYFLSGIEILQAIDARIDLTLIDQTGILEYGINPNNAIENYSGRTLFAKNENPNAFFPNLSEISYGDPFRIYGGTSVDLLFVDYGSKWVTISDGQEIDEINIRVNGVDQHRMIAEDIDLIVTIDKAYYKSQDKIWREWNDKINLIESVSQSYTLAPSTSSINEGSTLTTTVTTTNVTSGTTLYYSLSGIGITVADFSSGSLAGSGIVASNGSFSFSHTFSNDLTTEGSETLNIKLFTDSARTIQVGAIASVNIADTSITSNSSIESAGLTFLKRLSSGLYVTQGIEPGSVEVAIRKDTTQIYQGIYGNDWSVLAAETVYGVNQVLWKNTAANRLHLWKLDGNWNWQSSSLWDEVSSSIGQQLETEFEIDLDGNGTVAVASAAKIENIGSLKTLLGTINNDIITGQGGEIVYGGKGSDSLTGQSKISADGTRRIPSFLTGGSGDDTYFVQQGVFSVILDAGDGLDTVNMSGSNIDNIQFIRVNQRDIYAADATTSLLLIDPQGIEGKYNAIENFIIGNNEYSLTQLTSMAFGSSNFYGDYTYRELQSNGFFDLGIVGLDPLSINGYIELVTNNNKLPL